MKMIRVEYEEPPFRAIYAEDFLDLGQSEEEVWFDFTRLHDGARIRRIVRFDQKEDGGVVI